MRVLVFNVEGFRAGVERVAEVIRVTDPDVAMLTEVRFGPARRLARVTERGLAFGSARGGVFDPPSTIARARAAWAKAGLSPIALHECRHTYASFMIAAGVNAKALSTYMGHASITVTLDRYGHLMPGNEREAAGMLAAYLQREIARA